MSKQLQIRQRIAAVAARLMAEDGIDDFALAKRKAARQVGAGASQVLPGNEEIEEHLRAYQALYQGDEQREHLRELRLQAAAIMRELAAFHPYLSGQVLSGIAGRYGEIDLQVFTDDAKSLELLFLNRGVTYEVSEQRRWAGDQARAVTVLTLDWRETRVNLSLFAARDERAALRSSPGGRPIERATLAAVEQRVAQVG